MADLLVLLKEKQKFIKGEPEGNASQSNQCEGKSLELRDNSLRTFEAGNEN